MNFKYVYGWLVCLLVACGITAEAQVLSDGGRFEVAFDQGCAPFTVMITPLANFSEVKQYEYLGDGNVTSDTFFTFDTPGTYTIVQYTQNVSPVADQITITVIDPQTPEVFVSNCAANSVYVEITDTYYDRFEIDYDDGTVVQFNQGDVVPPHAYASQGTYNLNVRGIFNNAQDNCADTTVVLNTVNVITPATMTSLEVLNNDQNAGEIVLNYSLSPNITYELQMAVNGTAPFTTLDTLTTSGPYTISGLNTADDRYCFRILARDRCTGNDFYSDMICSLTFDGLAENNRNIMDWLTENIGFANYQVERDGSIIATINDFATSLYADTDVVCGVDYCYRIINNYSNGLISTSAPLCLRAFSTDTPEPINDITATILNDEVNLTWPAPLNFTAEMYFVYGSTDGGPFTLIDSTASPGYTDTNVSFPGRTYCYYISYRDFCGNTSENSIIACPVVLDGVLNGEEIQLDWNAYEGWENGVNGYLLEVLDENNNVIDSYNVGLTQQFTDNPRSYGIPVLRYRITALSNDGGGKESLSNIYDLTLTPNINLPNAFRPSSSNPMVNTFKAFGQFFTQFEMRIYNRWGELIFISNNIDQGWDGTYKGQPMPVGTYAYRVDFTDAYGNKSHQSGAVVLIR